MYPFLWGYCGPNNSSHWQLDCFLKLTKHAHCLVLQLRFFYHMFTIWGGSTMGTLRVLLRNSITREESSIWQRSGNQGNQWIRASVPLNTSWRVTQVPQGSQSDVSVCIWMQRVRSFVRSLYKRALATITTTTKTLVEWGKIIVLVRHALNLCTFRFCRSSQKKKLETLSKTGNRPFSWLLWRRFYWFIYI